MIMGLSTLRTTALRSALGPWPARAGFPDDNPRTPAGSGGADICEEGADVAAQGLGLPAELLGRGEDLARGCAGLRRRLVDADDVARDLAGAFRRPLHIASDLLRRRALFLDRHVQGAAEGT